MTRVHGIDVSNNNGSLNWTRIAASGVKFCYAKASESTTYVDSWYARYRAGAKDHGIAFGAYHFAHPSGNGTTQARFFLAKAKVAPGDLIPVLDVERTDGRNKVAVRKFVTDFANEVHRQLGVWPLLYSTASFINNYVGPRVGGMELWVAHWAVAVPAVPAGWPAWRVWQDGGTGLDHDVANLPLPIYRKEAPVPTPTPTPAVKYPTSYLVIRRSCMGLNAFYKRLSPSWQAEVDERVLRWVKFGR